MRFAALALSAVALIFSAQHASAQVTQNGDNRSNRGRSTQEQQEENGGRSRAPRIAPLSRHASAGPCPFVKILYDAARYVEMTGDRPAAANVGYTGEIQGLTSDCTYQGDEPISVYARIQFDFGRGPQAQGDGRTYRYWVAVTERNKAILEKTYFDLPVTFDGAQTTSVTQDQQIVIPRAASTVSGDNFEILVGFEVTPEMAEFNHSGSRFRVNAGRTPPAAPAAAAQPPAQ